MNHEPRVILTIVLSIGILVGYLFFFAPTPATAPQKPTQVTIIEDQKKPEVFLPKEEQQAKDLDPSFIGEDREIVIDTQKTRLVLSTRGGVLTSYGLKDYHVAAEKNSPTKDLLKETQGSFALFLGLKGYEAFDEGARFRVASDKVAGDRREIVLAWQDKNLRLERYFVFGGAAPGYVVTHSYKIINRTAMPLQITPYLEDRLQQKDLKTDNGFFSFLKFQQPDVFGSVYSQDKKLHSQMQWKNFASLSEQGGFAWSGITDRYFLSAVFQNQANADHEIQFEKKNEFLCSRYFVGLKTVPARGEFVGNFQNYIGPKELGYLNQAHPALSEAIDYGWFGFLAKPILWLMIFFHKVIPNWGLVIILLTFFVKLLLHSVNKKSLTSMKAMQQLKPKIDELKTKYKDDRQRQNQEMMQLFRTHKVNPMGGCLPMLLQFPVYIALYKVLWNAIEIYHAPFLVYADLSAPDPYFVSPILLGVFMFFQQKLTPTPSADPSQQKIMMIMPVMFSVFMLFLPVGLVIYIFVNTAMSVVQQYMMQHNIRFRDLIRGKWQPNGA